MKKKLLIGIVCLLLLAGGGCAAYFLGYFDDGDDQTTPDKPMKEPHQEEMLDNDKKGIVPTPDMPALVDSDVQPDHYFVSELSVAIMLQPDDDALKDGTAFYGEELRVMEHAQEWIRIAPIYQLEEDQKEVSQWVKIEGLSTEPVVLTGPRWQAILSDTIANSDDYNRYQERFFSATTSLIENKRCRLSDFIEVDGWIKSINHPNNIYFSYCGGLDVANKVYLNVSTGEIF
ncbi:hypothetical protein AB4560_19090 [Vibrio sp. 10N.222.51.C12]|uniref:hypothetical protein n=1 Tax=unclassified Vibrio TaxID=2614977 RepID=UPI000C8553C7|nr:hypothetical protein [Vibrio sp. 10N.286.48.B7]PMH80681.1 hypothetical protein BCU58_23005 [Vibrio sp. 10N.286.48.B7]